MLADFDLYPRAAYYVLREAHNVNPLLKTSEYEHVFKYILVDAVLRAGAIKLLWYGERLVVLRAEFTYNTR
jgi:hypothetical protein